MADVTPVYVRIPADAVPAGTAPPSRARIGDHPLHPMLVPFPIVCFVGTLVADLAYWRTADMMWADFSAWLLAVGVILGVVAAIVGLVDFLASPRIRAPAAAWIHMLGNLVVLALAVVNLLVHSRDAWSSVVPQGVLMSALTVLVLLVTGWAGWTLVYRHHVGVVE